MRTHAYSYTFRRDASIEPYCLHTYTHTYIHWCDDSNTSILWYIHTDVTRPSRHTLRYQYIRKYVCIHTHTYRCDEAIEAYSEIPIYTYVCMYTHTYIHTDVMRPSRHTLRYQYIHMYVCIHTHTYTQMWWGHRGILWGTKLRRPKYDIQFYSIL